jgi:sugar lactone lactonase YvrE
VPTIAVWSTGYAAGFPQGLAVDSSGNVYVAAGTSVAKLNSSGVSSTFATGFTSASGLAFDASGNLYVADSSSGKVYKVSPNGVSSPFPATLSSPKAVAVDSSGSIYVAEAGGHRVTQLSPAGIVTATPLPSPSVSAPSGVGVDASGNVYVSDTLHHQIKKISWTNGVKTVTPIAGAVTTGLPNVSPTPGTAAFFNTPTSLAVDRAGTVYVADDLNHMIRVITADGIITTIPASGFVSMSGIAVDSSGNIYVSDSYNRLVQKISFASGRAASSSPKGVVTTFVGKQGAYGLVNGTGTQAQFAGPIGVALDLYGNLYVGDQWNDAIRKVTSSGVVSTVISSSDSSAVNASYIHAPTGVAVDASGHVYMINNDDVGGQQKIIDISLSASPVSALGLTHGPGWITGYGVAVDILGLVYIADYNQCVIYKVSPSASTVLAGSQGDCAWQDGQGNSAKFSTLFGIAVDLWGNVYVADYGNNVIRKVTSAGVVTTLAGIPSSYGFVNGVGASAKFNMPYAVAVDTQGYVYVADTGNNAIRMITPGGVVTTLAGGTSGYANGTGTAARFNNPQGIAVDSAGNIYVSDTGNHVIRKITLQ